MPSDQTYTRRVTRELRALKVVFRRNWLLGVGLTVGLAAYCLNQAGLFHKEQGSADTSSIVAEILAQAKEYREKVAESDRLRDELVQLQGSANAAQAKTIDTAIAAREASLRSWAEGYLVMDPSSPTGDRHPSKLAVDAWLSLSASHVS